MKRKFDLSRGVEMNSRRASRWWDSIDGGSCFFTLCCFLIDRSLVPAFELVMTMLTDFETQKFASSSLKHKNGKKT